MSTLTLKQVGDLAFEVKTEHWTLRIDVPEDLGGHNTGPKPTELVAAGLAACKAITAIKWATIRGAKVQGIEAQVSYEMVDHPRRMGPIEVRLSHLKGQIEPALHERLERAVESCHVAQTLKQPPAVHTRIE